MTNNSTNSSNLSLRPILEWVKLNGTNYLDWDINLIIVFKLERKEYVLDQAIPGEPAHSAIKAVKDVYQKHLNESFDMARVMLDCVEADLQKQFMELSDDLFAMIGQIKDVFKGETRIERYDTLQELFACKM